ncbi:hypothetical protein JZM32_06625 [Acinetobacter pittii]|uniref:hypothetical protein n=1 Tax=Acinetobacter pittii TaxID=48296 RepID=UPI00197F846A|nr:hypothetical protein [Acinetobacter pittii]MBN6527660.1 hypothetical protein [Acinetobacter pittii]MBN6536447.1 hypothetical protein [Acinetobacter pittii]MEB6671244.1 hypothetical protein [Acinetobacter pittii]
MNRLCHNHNNFDLFNEVEHSHKLYCIERKEKNKYYNQLDSFNKYCFTDDFYSANVKLVRYELNNEGRKASVYAVIIIDHWFDQCEYDNINSFLSIMLVDINCLTKWSIVSLLRSTYSAKNLLSNWQDFYEKSYEVLEQKNYNAKKLLKGLNR